MNPQQGSLQELLAKAQGQLANLEQEQKDKLKTNLQKSFQKKISSPISAPLEAAVLSGPFV